MALKPTSVKFRPETMKLRKQLARKLAIYEAQVIDLAIKELAVKHGLWPANQLPTFNMTIPT